MVTRAMNAHHVEAKRERKASLGQKTVREYRKNYVNILLTFAKNEIRILINLIDKRLEDLEDEEENI